MDAAWVEVIVLTLAECVAPAGKSVCQEQETQYYFVEQEQCEAVLEQLLAYRGQLDNVIVNAENSSCLPTARSQPTYRSAADAEKELSGSKGWSALSADAAPKDFMQDAHEKRLEGLPECNANADVTPCKRGQIIIEPTQAEQTQVWRQRQ